MKHIAALAALTVLLAGCDPYANNGTGNTKINEITVYGNVRCVLVVQGSSNTITCDWDHAGATQRAPN
jgi:hypothetical protein